MGNEEIIALLPAILQGKATEGQETAVRSWLEESEENRKIYQEYCRAYYRLHYFGQWKKIDVSEAVETVKRKTHTPPSHFGRWFLFSGAAALFLLCVGLFWLLQQEKPVQPSRQQLARQIKTGERKALLTLPDGKQVELTTDYKVDIDLGTVQAMEDSTIGLFYQVKDSTKLALEYHVLTVPRAGEYIMALSDGTRVWLNSETEIKYPVVFRGDKREVFVTGEAFFEVVKDSLHPFVVHTPCTQTTVLGTSFNVMAYRDEQQTEITLLEGAVAVRTESDSRCIHPGQQIQVDNLSMKMNCREVNTDRYASWKDGLFDFEGMTLDELSVKLSRWYDVDFFFVNAGAKTKKFTGAIKRNNSLQFMLDFIEKTSEVRFEVQGNVVRVYE